MAYIRTFFLAFSLSLVLACAINWLVDPYGMYWSPHIEGLNAQKPAAPDRVRVTKAYRAPEATPEILIAGNSRVEMGLSPMHPVFGGRSVYNLGLPGAGVAMQLDYALNALRLGGNVERVIVSIDFLDFLYRPDYLQSWSLSGAQPGYMPRLSGFSDDWRGQWFRLKEKAALVFSLDSLAASVTTLASQSRRTNSITRRGQNTAGSYSEIIAAEGIDALFVQKLDELTERLQGKQFAFDGGHSPSPAIAAFTAFLDEMASRGIRVDVFINPYHYSYVMLLDDLGLSELFLDWKRFIAERVAAHVHERRQVSLWDFSGFGPEVREALPEEGSGTAMTWFWEPAHYRETLGDRVLDSLRGQTGSAFGVRLTLANVDDVVAGNRRDIAAAREDWRRLKRRLNL
jgi:hypothetical protein